MARYHFFRYAVGMNDMPDTVSKKDAAWLLRDKYNNVKSERYEADLERLAKGEPLGYVIGWVPFLGLTITLASHPLIPRPETEWWTEKMITEELCKKLKQCSVLDLCAGSGAIGCSVLSKCHDTHVTFSDNIKEHEATIHANIVANNINKERTHVVTGDLFDALRNKTFDLIAINPPYIPKHRTLPRSVDHYEPHEALYSGTDGLSLIRRIAKELRAHLSTRGSAWIEIDAEYAPQARDIFEDNGFVVTLHNDHYGRPRVLAVH